MTFKSLPGAPGERGRVRLGPRRRGHRRGPRFPRPALRRLLRQRALPARAGARVGHREDHPARRSGPGALPTVAPPRVPTLHSLRPSTEPPHAPRPSPWTRGWNRRPCALSSRAWPPLPRTAPHSYGRSDFCALGQDREYEEYAEIPDGSYGWTGRVWGDPDWWRHAIRVSGAEHRATPVQWGVLWQTAPVVLAPPPEGEAGAAFTAQTEDDIVVALLRDRGTTRRTEHSSVRGFRSWVAERTRLLIGLQAAAGRGGALVTTLEVETAAAQPLAKRATPPDCTPRSVTWLHRCGDRTKLRVCLRSWMRRRTVCSTRRQRAPSCPPSLC
jgi:hypothetical protein